MSDEAIRRALGVLQDDADDEQAFADLRSALDLAGGGPEAGRGDALALLGAARRAHAARGEWGAVADLLGLEAELARGTELEADRLEELVRVEDEERFDDVAARDARTRLRALRPDDERLARAAEDAEVRRTKWREMADRFLAEAREAGDDGLRAALLVRAADVLHRYGRAPEAPASDPAPGKRKRRKRAGGEGAPAAAATPDEILALLDEALAVDAKNGRALRLVERVLRDAGRFDELATRLEGAVAVAASAEERAARLARLARVRAVSLGDAAGAEDAYVRLLDAAPGHREASRWLVDALARAGRSEDLAALYERLVARGGLPSDEESAVVLQLALVCFRMLGDASRAEPWFDRLRRTEPAHPSVLAFFRERAAETGDRAKLTEVLTDALAALSEGEERRAVAEELGALVEGALEPAKALEHWRGVLRGDPGNRAARAALKRLYAEAGQHGPLAELLRSELEGLDADDPSRLDVLRALAALQRDHLRNEASLAVLLAQIVQLDDRDLAAHRELSALYERLGRFRDLLQTQVRLAEIEPDAAAQAELHRAVARRWLDQFSNVQNAVEAYERLLRVAPTDAEARQKLRELYGKRRAHRALFELYAVEAELETGEPRRALQREMAKLAAERLDRPKDAIALYRRVLAEAPDDREALEAVERLAERDKDFATLAEVLEERARGAGGGADADRAELFRRAGALYAERLERPEAALAAYRRALELAPGNARTLRAVRDMLVASRAWDALEALYGDAADWEGLVEVLSAVAERTDDEALRVDLSYRVADLLTTRLGAPERAFRSYERVLAVRPRDLRAARALAPLYEADEKWARLPSLYELLAEAAETDAERVGWLVKLTVVTSERLAERAKGFEHAQKAYTLDPTTLDVFEAAARRAGAFAPFVEALEARLTDASLGAEERARLLSLVADVRATSLDDAPAAVRVLRKVVEENPNDERSLQRLTDLVRASGDRDDVRWLYRLRVDRAKTAQRLDLLAEWATLEEEVFEAIDRATALYREMLEKVPTHGGALRSLARLLAAAGDVEGAVAVLERDRDAREGEDRVARDLEIAELWLEPGRKPGRAFEVVRGVLDQAPGHARAVALVERLLPHADARAAAAVLLDEHYASVRAFPRQAEVLEVRLATAASKADRLPLLRRLATAHERGGHLEGVLATYARAAAEFPQDLETWDGFAVAAQRGRREAELAEALSRAVDEAPAAGVASSVVVELARRAARAFDEGLGDVDRALVFLDRVLAAHPDDLPAFERAKQILTIRERWDDLEAMSERTIAATDDPAVKVERLLELALVAEEITQDQARAVSHYERVVALVPEHEAAGSSLESLYTRLGQWDALVRLLDARRDRAEGDQRAALDERLGLLNLDRRGDVGGALDALARVLAHDAYATEARAAVERILAVSGFERRAADVLAEVYEERGDVRDLVRVLEVRLRHASPDEERGLLRRIATLKDERLTDDAAAFDTYARLVPLSPDDADARSRFLAVVGRLAAHARGADVLLSAAERAEAGAERARILEDAATELEAAGERGRAAAALRRVLDEVADDAHARLDALRRLVALADDPAELASLLEATSAIEESAEAKSDDLRRLAELRETRLDDAPGAVRAWRERLALDERDHAALEALDRLLTRAGDAGPLAQVLAAREQLVESGDARRDVLGRLARLQAGPLGLRAEAIETYRTLREDFGDDDATLDELARLLEAEGLHEDLADVLEARLGLAADDAARAELLVRLARVRREALGAPEAALDAATDALEAAPESGHAVAELEALLALPDVALGAARVLGARYRAAGAWPKLLGTLAVEIAAEDDPAAKLALLEAAAEVSETHLDDAPRAFAATLDALPLAAEEGTARPWVERAERLARRAGAFGGLADAYEAVLPEVLDEALRLELGLRVGELAATELHDHARAVAAYGRVLEAAPGEERALEALERLHDAANEVPELLAVLEQRAAAAEGRDERLARLFRRARVADQRARDVALATAVYEEVLDVELHPDAVDALRRLYAEGARWPDLAALYERILETPELDRGARTRALYDLAVVVDDRLEEPERAFELYEEILKVDPEHAETVARLERMLDGGAADTALRAATTLEHVHVGRGDWRGVMRTLDARARLTQDPDERRALVRRLAKLHEEQQEDFGAALDVHAKLLADDPFDADTRDELERLAKVAGAEARLASIYASVLDGLVDETDDSAALALRTGRLYDGLGDVERALTLYRRALAFAPGESPAAFAALDGLFVRTSRPGERVALYRASLEHRFEPAARVAALHTIADLEENERGDAEAALAAHREAREIDPDDVRSTSAVERLLRAGARHEELAAFYEARAASAASGDAEAARRLDRARVLAGPLARPADALDEAERVLELAPAGDATAEGALALLWELARIETLRQRAVEHLAPVYESRDDAEKLVALADLRLLDAEAPEERAALLRARATSVERTGGAAVAFGDAARAFALDPEDDDGLELLERLAGVRGAWGDLVSALEGGLAAANTGRKRDIQERLAKLHDARLDDPRRALAAWEAALALDPADASPLDQVEELASLLSDWAAMVRALEQRLVHALGDDERASLHRRIAELRRDMLDDPDGAVVAYEAALVDEPGSAFTVDRLLELLEAKGASPRRLELLRRRAELAEVEGEEAGARAGWLEDAARVAEALDDRDGAIALLVEAGELVEPTDARLEALGRLYEATGRSRELAEVLASRAERTDDVAAAQRFRLARAGLLASALDAPEEALDAYARLLDAADDDEARAGVRALGEAHESLALRASDVLAEHEAGRGRWSEVIRALELRVRTETEAAARATTWRRLAEVAERELADVARAEAALAAALHETPDDGSLYADLERVARLGGREALRRFVVTSKDEVPRMLDARVSADVWAAVARVAAKELEDDREAAESYRRALELGGDDAGLLDELADSLGRLGAAKELADVLERRVAQEDDVVRAADLDYRLARVRLDALADKREALRALRAAVERHPKHEDARRALEGLVDDPEVGAESFEALEVALREAPDPDGLVRLFEGRLASASDAVERRRARLDLARVLEQDVGAPDRAQRVVEAALAAAPLDADLKVELDRLADVSGDRAGATAALAAALETFEAEPGDAARVAALWSEVATAREAADAAGAEVALRRALALEPDDLGRVRALEQLVRTAGRAGDLVEVLRTRARLEPALPDKRVALEEAASAADGLGDAALVEVIYRQMLAESDADPWALEGLTRVREAAGDHREVVDLLLRRADAESDGERIVELRRRAAELVVERLGDLERGVRLHEELFQAEPQDDDVASALATLYRRREDHRGLARLLGRLVDVTERAERRTQLRLELGRLRRDALGEPEEARAAFEAVLDEEPAEPSALEELASLLKAASAHARLADVLERAVAAAGEPAREAALGFRLARLLDERLGEGERALAAYDRALELAPDDRDALARIADLAERRGDHTRAAAALERAAGLETDGAAAVAVGLRLADARAAAGDAPGVEAALVAALGRDASRRDVRDRLRAHYETHERWDEVAGLYAGDAELVRAAGPAWTPPVSERTSLPPGRASLPPGRASFAPPAEVPAHVTEQVELLRKAATVHAERRGAPADAADLLERASALVPWDRSLLGELAEAHEQAGAAREAAAVLVRLVDTYAGRRAKEAATPLHRLAKLEGKLGDREAALGHLDQAFKMDPGSVDILRDLGLLALEAGDLERAQKTFRALLLQRLDGAGITKAEVFFQLGVVAERQGDKPKAVQMFERALEGDPGLATAKDKLAELRGA